LAEEVLEYRGLGGFDQVVIEARLFGPLLVFLLSPTGQRDQQDSCTPGLLPNLRAASQPFMRGIPRSINTTSGSMF
jgi:hypothetical protein